MIVDSSSMQSHEWKWSDPFPSDSIFWQRIQHIRNKTHSTEAVLAHWVFDDQRVLAFHTVFDDIYRCILHPTDDELRWGRAELFRQANMLHDRHPTITDWSVFEDTILSHMEKTESPHPHSSWLQCLQFLRAELPREEFEWLKRSRADEPLSERVRECCEELHVEWNNEIYIVSSSSSSMTHPYAFSERRVHSTSSV